MGMQESGALSSTAHMLELAVATGDFVPGSRGWKRHQQELVRVHLNRANVEFAGGTLLDAIRHERLRTWIDSRRSPTRRHVLEPLITVLHWPPEPPDGVHDPVPPLHWLLSRLVDGQPLTQTGNLSRALVHDAAGRFGSWDQDLHSLPRGEDELYDLHQIRCLAQRFGLARRSARKLVLTAKGRKALDDGDSLWRAAAGGLLPDDDFVATLGEVTLAVLLGQGSIAISGLQAVLNDIVEEVDWRTVETGGPPSEHDIGWAWHETTNLLRALSLLSSGGNWLDHPESD